MAFRFLPLFIGAATGLFLVPTDQVWAQTIDPARTGTPVAQTPDSPAYNLIYVDAGTGHDDVGDGTQMKPLQTIRHALTLSSPNSIIVLAPGEYSEASGERFPLQLQPGVTLQGSPGFSGTTAIIRGSGVQRMPDGRYLQVTLVAADHSGLGNITITNENTVGYGVLVNGGSPVLRENTFTHNGYAGVYVIGPGQPMIQRNYFTENGRVGLIIEGNSTAMVEGNIFENTGTGIRVAPGAEPQIRDNRIVQNQDGIILAADARPRLQQNLIARNRRNGMVEFGSAFSEPTPTSLGTGPGRPAFAASPTITPPVISAPPSTHGVSPGGVVDRSVVFTQPPPQASVVHPEIPDDPDNGEQATGPDRPSVEPIRPATPATAPPPDSSRPQPATEAVPTPVLEVGPPSPATAPSPEPVPPTLNLSSTPPSAQPTAMAITTAPTASPIEADSTATAPQQPAPDLAAIDQSDQLVASAIAPSSPATTDEVAVAVPLQVIPAAEPDTRSASTGRSVPPTVATAPPDQPIDQANRPLPALPAPAAGDSLLPVPSPNIPMGSGGRNLPTVALGSTPPLADNPPPPPSRAASLGLHYRLLVPASDTDTQNQIRQLVADAFRVRVDNEVMMQVGAYADQATATAKAQELMDQGLEVQIESVP